jgi:ribosome biogenesis GTPase / thiamine phosphate phosphatase
MHVDYVGAVGRTHQKKDKRGEVKGLPGMVVATVGRAVLVRDDHGERVCVLSGQRAVIGDRVRWVEVQDAGGKLVGVERRDTSLSRKDHRGKEQVLAANLRGLLVVAAVQHPPFRPGLLDRYVVAAAVGGLEVAVVLTKTDLGIPDSVQAPISHRKEYGLPFLWVSNVTGEGVDGVREFVEEQGGGWALVGHSGVGKTSLAAKILPEIDAGPVRELSDYWERGQHTTTASTWFDLDGGAIVDSPGIRTFSPSGLSPEEVRRHFPGVLSLRCKYRGCLHRVGEEGCVIEDELPVELATSYRRLLEDVEKTHKRY